MEFKAGRHLNALADGIRQGYDTRASCRGFGVEGMEGSLANSDAITPKKIHIENASSSWGLMLQSGVEIAGTVGMPVDTFLSGELGISEEIIARIEVVLLDGMPVDDIASAILTDKARLALAAGLPGIAGLAMKRGSAVKALRGGITYIPVGSPRLQSGSVILVLYSLVIPMLAPQILRKGALVNMEQVRRYARFAPDDICISSSGTIPVDAWLERFGKTSGEKVFFSADI